MAAEVRNQEPSVLAYQLARLAAVGDPVAAEAAAVPSWQELGQVQVLPEPRQVAW